MVYLHTQILCISITLFALALGGIEGQQHKHIVHHTGKATDLNHVDPSNIHHHQVPGNSTGSHVHHYSYRLPGKSTNHTYRYKVPGKSVNHTFRYKRPGQVHHHSYRYKNPGKVHRHTYRYKQPGKVDHHSYRYRLPGKTDTHTYRYRLPQLEKKKPVTGVYYIINMMYNYFAVGGHLTGVPPVDILLLRYYMAEGPRKFCPQK
ncbi:hypothetical protein TNCT_475212 [Trichonephila clavata]|uniref:Uncharacterized protein n=1 Tax=Trichonephila clavata TaxID=2740835 RepID=A0A8X6KPL9_TRICU|nr:hypothetical protein TNCT_475212 [Trichonephila clavata]